MAFKYVDNITTSCDTEQEAVKYYKEAQSIMLLVLLKLYSIANTESLTAAGITNSR